MPFPKKQFQPRPTELQWKLLKLPPSGSAEGWVRAPLVGMDSHHGSWTQGCRAFVTEGALPCSYCESGSPPREIGYLPLLLEDKRRCVAQLSHTVCLYAERLAVGDYVRLSRSKVVRDPLRVELLEPLPTQRQYAEILERVGPVDVTRWLLGLWKDHELTKWYTKHRMTRVVVPCTDPPLPSQSDPVSIADILSGANHAPAPTPHSAGTRPAESAAAAWRAAKAGRNGARH